MLDQQLAGAESLLKKLGLTMRSALETPLLVKFKTSIFYEKAEYEFWVIKPVGVEFSAKSLTFFFPKMRVVTINVNKVVDNDVDLVEGDELHITGLDYYGSNRWYLVGEIIRRGRSGSASIEEYYSYSQEGMLEVQVLS